MSAASFFYARIFPRAVRMVLSESSEHGLLGRVERLGWIALSYLAYPFVIAYWFRDEWIGWLKCRLLRRHTWTGSMVEDGIYSCRCGVCRHWFRMGEEL